MSVSCRFHDDRFRGEAALKFQVPLNPDFMKSRRYSGAWGAWLPLSAPVPPHDARKRSLRRLLRDR
eukprot:1148066-Prymnesium_polylepis.1